MPADPYHRDPLGGRSGPLDDAIATARLIDQLPRTMTALPLLALTAGGAGQPWQASITLTPEDQAAMGSVIEPVYGMALVRAAGEPQLRLISASTLWWVANAPPPLLRAFLDRLAAEVRHRQGA